MESSLNEFAEILDADEVLLFEKATFLVISHAQRHQHRDVHRFEKISNIIKQFKLSCSKLAAHFQSMEVRNSNFSAFIDVFTANTYVMVILSDSQIPSGSTPSGSVDPSSLLCPPSSRCGSPSRSTTSVAHPLSTASASKPKIHSFVKNNYYFYFYLKCGKPREMFEHQHFCLVFFPRLMVWRRSATTGALLLLLILLFRFYMILFSNYFLWICFLADSTTIK